MRIYLVGGAVRDTLLGRPVKDRDWVVVGATPGQLLAQGFLPVGRDFPVFLHPHTREEYALARTERKTAPGYHGFVFHAEPGVTLEQDLARRDLTINAMAVDATLLDAEGRFDPEQLSDPFGGLYDLRARRLHHVGEAFHEDPVRVLRVARFAARFTDFHVAHETRALMRSMVAHGEVSHLVAERVWQELARGLMEPQPARMLAVLHDCGADAVLLPELPPDAHRERLLGALAAHAAPLEARFAALCLSLPHGPRAGHGPIAALAQRLRAPVDCRALAEVAARERAALHAATALAPAGLVELLERCDAFRKPERFDTLLLLLRCDALAGGLSAEAAAAPVRHLQAAHAAARGVATQAIAARAAGAGHSGPMIGSAVHAARVAAVAAI